MMPNQYLRRLDFRSDDFRPQDEDIPQRHEVEQGDERAPLSRVRDPELIGVPDGHAPLSTTHVLGGAPGVLPVRFAAPRDTPKEVPLQADGRDLQGRPEVIGSKVEAPQKTFQP